MWKFWKYIVIKRENKLSESAEKILKYHKIELGYKWQIIGNLHDLKLIKQNFI